MKFTWKIALGIVILIGCIVWAVLVGFAYLGC